VGQASEIVKCCVQESGREKGGGLGVRGPVGCGVSSKEGCFGLVGLVCGVDLLLLKGKWWPDGEMGL